MFIVFRYKDSKKMSSTRTKVIIILVVGGIIALFGILTGSFWHSINNWLFVKVSYLGNYESIQRLFEIRYIYNIHIFLYSS